MYTHCASSGVWRVHCVYTQDPDEEAMADDDDDDDGEGYDTEAEIVRGGLEAASAALALAEFPLLPAMR